MGGGGIGSEASKVATLANDKLYLIIHGNFPRNTPDLPLSLVLR